MAFSKRALLHPLAYELSRSRRYGRSFALIALDLSRDDHARPRWRHDEENPAFRRLRALLRSTDSLWKRGESAVILLPETSVEEVATFALRLATELPDLLSVDAIRYVVFPEDGLTSGALMSTLGPTARPILLRGTEIAPGELVSGVPVHSQEAPLVGAPEDESADV